ncbi:MAG: hypothetical protein P4L51_16845 [Puia sp.]|nr:hypothetical protein [Puia sp.]
MPVTPYSTKAVRPRTRRLQNGLFTVLWIFCWFYPHMGLLAQQPDPPARKSIYADGRPFAWKRIPCHDEGIVLKYGNGPDSCDVYGAREANVNHVGDLYYLFYDGAGSDGWKSCLAVSRDLRTWTKRGAILALGAAGANDSKSASSPWVIEAADGWHMFYLGTPHTSPPPYRIPSFPYLTMKAHAKSIEGPWVKDYALTPFFTKPGTYYSATAAPGFIVKKDDEYLQFFSPSIIDSAGRTKRTLGIARTKDLNTPWTVDPTPVVPLEEQVENTSLYFEKTSGYWLLFTNHIGLDKTGEEYTDAIWVYWSKDLNKWDAANKAVVLDSLNCSWAKGAIGMPSVIRVGDKLALLYDAPGGTSINHMHRNIGLAWLSLPVKIPD